MQLQFTLLDLYSFSILLAAVIGWVRFKNIHPTFYPFIYLCWIAAINEIISYFLIYSRHSNAVNFNSYQLAEAVLTAWLFRNWSVFQRRKNLFWILIASYILFWIVEMVVFSRITSMTSYFRVYYSFIIVLMTIDALNRQLVAEKEALLTNPKVLICLGFILYFALTVIGSIFWIYGVDGSKSFRRAVIWILIYSNVATNIIYAIATLWMPRKLRYTLPY